MLSSCQPHYIRCFKPNNNQAAGVFEEPLVLEQIIQCGTVELVRIMHDGFPNRCSYVDLMQRFQAMLPADFSRYGARTFIEALMRAYNVPSGQWALGLTRLFLKAGQLQTLEALRDEGVRPEAEHLKVIIRDIVRRKWRRAGQAICLALWLPKFAARVREERRLRRLVICRRWRGAIITVRWCLAEGSQIRRKRRHRLEKFLYGAARIVIASQRWIRRARATLEARRAREVEERNAALAVQAEEERARAALEAKRAQEAEERSAALAAQAEEERRLLILEFTRKQNEMKEEIARLHEKNARLNAEEADNVPDVCPSTPIATPTPARGNRSAAEVLRAFAQHDPGEPAAGTLVRKEQRWVEEQRQTLLEDLGFQEGAQHRAAAAPRSEQWKGLANAR